jgi:hypothetical protein
VLGHPGQKQPDEEIRAGIGRLIRDALDKPAEYPYVIFIDLNLPPCPGPSLQKPWAREVAETVDQIAREKGNQDPFNLIVFTNQPDHYGEGDEPAPMGDIVSVLGRNPRIVPSHLNAILAIHDSANKFGIIPNSFEEAS